MDAFKKAAGEGRFGKLTSASAYVKWFRDQAYDDSAGWRGTWALDGGGALMNQSVHTVDALLYLAGPAKSVTAVTACQAHERIEVEDSIVATVEFENESRLLNAPPARGQKTATQHVYNSLERTALSFSQTNPSRCGTSAKKSLEDAEFKSTLMKGQEAGLGANDPSAINFYQHQRNFEEVVQSIQETGFARQMPLRPGRPLH